MAGSHVSSTDRLDCGPFIHGARCMMVVLSTQVWYTIEAWICHAECRSIDESQYYR